MRKTLLSLVMVVVFILSACSAPATQSTKSNDSSITSTSSSAQTPSQPASGGKIVGYCMPDTSEPFLANLSNTVKQKFAADGVDVQIANAAGDAATQVSQIENFATMGAKLIIVMAVDPTSVADAIKKAQAKGSKVLVAGSDTGAYDALMFIDQKKDGEMIAQLGADWIKKTFPGADPKSVEVAILESRDTPEANQRCDGMAEIEALCPAAKVVKVVGGVKQTETGMAAAENIFQTNPNVKMILSYNSNGSLGVNSFAMKPNSPVKDKSKFATFASDFTPEVLQAVKDSASNKSVFRGVVKFGSNDLPGDTYKLAKKILSGESYEKKNPDPLTPITPENASQF